MYNENKGDVTRWDGKKLSNKQIPIEAVYKNFLKKLIEKNEIITAMIARMAGEAGMCRMEIAEALISNINLINHRGLWLDTAKQVRGRYAKESHMRTREIPLNLSLYNFLLENIDTDRQKYIIPRKKGNINKPYSYRHMNWFFEKNNLPFTIHMLRHYFKSMVWSWMIRNKQPDIGVLKEFLGHAKNVHESYGLYSWEYKLSIVDSVFCERPPPDLQEAIVKAIKNGFDSVQSAIRGAIEQETLEPTAGARQQVIGQEVLIPSSIRDWISKVITPRTPNELYLSILNNSSFPLYHTNGLSANAVLQLIKESNLAAYSTIINTPGGKLWMGKQLKNSGLKVRKL